VEKDAKNRILALEARLFTLEKTIGDFQTISQPSLDPLGTHNGKDLTSILDKVQLLYELLQYRVTYY
jgi:inhibitor of KinA sporulation pathway (predicted exonuclease)